MTEKGEDEGTLTQKKKKKKKERKKWEVIQVTRSVVVAFGFNQHHSDQSHESNQSRQPVYLSALITANQNTPLHEDQWETETETQQSTAPG